MSITVLVQLLFLFSILHSHSGGKWGSRSSQDGTPGDGIDRIKVMLLPTAETVDSKPQTKIANPTQSPPQVTATPASPLISDSAIARAAVPPNYQSESRQGRIAAHPDTTARASNSSGANSNDFYLSAVREAIARAWQAQGGGVIPTGCEIAVDQTTDAQGAKAIRAWTVNCEALPVGEQIRLETAALQAQLPYVGYESMFQSHLELTY